MYAGARHASAAHPAPQLLSPPQLVIVAGTLTSLLTWGGDVGCDEACVHNDYVKKTWMLGGEGITAHLPRTVLRKVHRGRRVPEPAAEATAPRAAEVDL